jgi:hypothetical protein
VTYELTDHAVKELNQMVASDLIELIVASAREAANIQKVARRSGL